MTLCAQKDVEFYAGDMSTTFDGSVGYNYEDSIQEAIKKAARKIEDFCNAPEDYFEPGGALIEKEILNGADVAYLSTIRRFPTYYSGGTAHLKFKTRPVLSVVKLEEETSPATWTTRTEGSSSDYIVVDDGVRYVNNTPALTFANVRASYKAGFLKTPGKIVDVCARLAAKILQHVEDSQLRGDGSLLGLSVRPSKDAGLGEPQLTDDMKSDLEKYVLIDYGFS